jgi:hypothetical protein
MLSFCFVIISLISNNFLFCFSNSGWGIGPSGGIVEPDLVTRIRLDDGAEGHFIYGPSLSLDRDPFVNERYMFGDGKYHNCGLYLEMEKDFFRENAAVVREVFFDTDSLLGVDSEEDLNVEEAVNYEDLVPDILPEGNQAHDAAVEEIMNMNIERVSPVNWDSDDEETMERVTSPMVVEAVSDLQDISVATGSSDNVVNDQPGLLFAANVDSEDEETKDRVSSLLVVETFSDPLDTSAPTGSVDNDVNTPPSSVTVAEVDSVEKVVEDRAELPSDPGPFSEDVSMDDFLPSPRRGSVPFLTFSDAAGDEVSLYFFVLSGGAVLL